jgi:biopolymer transport protein ExbD
MLRFNRKDSDKPIVSTASLPDIVFILLFFFMTVTVVRDKTLMVQNELPNASETGKLTKKDRIIYIYIGAPVKKYSTVHGAGPKIQIDDRLLSLSEIGAYVIEKRNRLPESIRKSMKISLKIDKNANMGPIADLQKELRKVGAFSINYTTCEGDPLENMLEY